VPSYVGPEYTERRTTPPNPSRLVSTRLPLSTVAKRHKPPPQPHAYVPTGDRAPGRHIRSTRQRFNHLVPAHFPQICADLARHRIATVGLCEGEALGRAWRCSAGLHATRPRTGARVVAADRHSSADRAMPSHSTQSDERTRCCPRVRLPDKRGASPRSAPLLRAAVRS
jgi:hypothetical protein